ncbi:MAG: ZIP family metal transporter [Gemmatimonadetes bacterium]|nr:ZIP family metal transporter [Gemmatimonadota bacterium]NNL30392.1 ZIP family metal transporter [Gemmatimonadota bacterium]
MSDWLVVFLYALATAVATGLGALPFLFFSEVSDRFVAYANAIAAGLMLGASFGLVAEGTAHGRLETLGGVLIGVVFILVTQRYLADYDEEELVFGAAQGESARKMFLMLIVMTVHSFSEGVAVGVSFGGGIELATVITVAIAVHNIPEGVAISAVMRPRGVSIAGCAGWSIVSSLPQPLMAVPAFLFVEAFRPGLPWGIGFAAGAMIFMVLGELLPDALEEGRRSEVATLTTATIVAMMLFQRFL